jgi:2-polyprenyl-3-methyl-5-hydroxy-6-metoxy-1,4-benzoquinol methylase
MAVETESTQKRVNAYFQSSSDYWKRIYETRALMPLIYQTRQAAVLDWITELRMPASSSILEIGCGAGVLTSELARAGYCVEAVDAAPAMVELTRQNAAKNNLAGRVRTSLADVHDLSFANGKFDLVVAIGVIPWLHDEARGLREMQRVLKPAGRLIVTADNELRLIRLLDPASSPASLPFRCALKSFLRVAGLYNPSRDLCVKMHTPSEIRRLFEQSGLQQVKSRCVGFGPFKFFGRVIVPERIGIALHTGLQSLADRGFPPFHLTGSHYLAIAQKLATD